MKVYIHLGKTGGSFIRQCIKESNTKCLIAFKPEDIVNASPNEYNFCYVHSRKTPKILKLLKSYTSNLDLYTTIRHPISSFISSVRHARRENNYSILPKEVRLLYGSYSDLKFNNLNKKMIPADGACLNNHQYKIHGASTYLDFLLSSGFFAPSWLMRYTKDLSLGNKAEFLHNCLASRNYLEGKAENLALQLGSFKYIGLYELFSELLEKLSQEGFINTDAIEKSKQCKVNAGTESDEDAISTALAFKWLNAYPSDFFHMEYLIRKNNERKAWVERKINNPLA